MSNTADALPAPPVLPEYGGKKVLRTVIALRNAGDGLSEGMSIDPQLLPIGTTVYTVTESVVVAHNHKPLRGKDPDYLELEQVLSAGTATIVEKDQVVEMLDKQRRRLELAKEAKEGVGRIPYDDELHKAHEEGLHSTGTVPGCADCDAEIEAAKAEASPEGAEVTQLPTGRKRKS
jgi:hypothetical protein